MNPLDQLKDIKASQTIQIDLLPYFLGITVLLLILIAIVLYFTLTKKKKPTKRALAIKQLKSLDFEALDDKQLAYKFCYYGYMCLDDHYKDEFKKIEQDLEEFKYKKEVPPIDEDLKLLMKDYIKVRL